MRYLKHFESFEDNTQMGITTDEVKECFYDLSDEGWDIRTRFAKKMFNSKGIPQHFDTNTKPQGKINLELIPYLEIKIHKKSRPNGTPINSSIVELQDLQETDTYKHCMSLFSGRLDEYDLFISVEAVQRIVSGGSQIYILIYRKLDENYIK